MLFKMWSFSLKLILFTERVWTHEASGHKNWPGNPLSYDKDFWPNQTWADVWLRWRLSSSKLKRSHYLHASCSFHSTPSIRSCSNGLSDNTIIVFASSPLAPFVSLCWSGKHSWNRPLSRLDPLLISQSHSLNGCISWFRSGRASLFHLIVNTNAHISLLKTFWFFSFFLFKIPPCCHA